MTQDVPQWLSEIQSLQQRLAHVSQERSNAYEQVARWQRSYQTEAAQRRKDIRRLQTVIYRLDQENKRLKHQLDLPPNERSPLFMSNRKLSQTTVQTPIHSLQSSPPSHSSTVLQQKLQEALTECDRLAKTLTQEQAEHEQTRQTLMTALGDTVEQLERERKRHIKTAPSEQDVSTGVVRSTLPLIAQQQENSPASLTGHSQKRLAPAPPHSDYKNPI